MAFKGDAPLGRFDTSNNCFARFDCSYHPVYKWHINDITCTEDYVWFATSLVGIVRMTKTDYPVIQSAVPTDGAENVSPNTEINVTFSHPMQWEQFNNQTLSLWTGKLYVQTRVHYDPSTHKATINTTGPLKSGTTYKVLIQDGLRDIYDEPLPQHYSYTFSTSP